MAPDWPPVIEEDLDGSPVRYPSKYDETFHKETFDAGHHRVGTDEVDSEQTEAEHSQANHHGPPADAQEFIQILTRLQGSVAKVTADRFGDMRGGWRG